MRVKTLFALLLLLACSTGSAAAPVTFSFQFVLDRTGCHGLDVCTISPDTDPAVLTVEVELTDPFANQTVSAGHLVRATYGAPFPFLGPVITAPRLDGTYIYDRPSGIATLDLDSYFIIASRFTLTPRTADLTEVFWRYDGGLSFYEGMLRSLPAASTFVGAPIPLPGMLPALILAVASLGAYRRKVLLDHRPQ